MKKKILGGVAIFTIAALLAFNASLTTKGSNSGISLKSLSFCTQALAENSVLCIGDECQYINGNYYATSTNTTTGERICCGIASASDRGCRQS